MNLPAAEGYRWRSKHLFRFGPYLGEKRAFAVGIERCFIFPEGVGSYNIGVSRVLQEFKVQATCCIADLLLDVVKHKHEVTQSLGRKRQPDNPNEVLMFWFVFHVCC